MEKNIPVVIREFHFLALRCNHWSYTLNCATLSLSLSLSLSLLHSLDFKDLDSFRESKEFSSRMVTDFMERVGITR